VGNARAAMTGFRAAIDIGGTYTDIIVAGGGVVYRSKLPSTPDDYARAVIDGLLALLARHRIAPAVIEAVLHGTTIATNTIRQERGARVGLLTTRGFRAILEIARLRRASLYDLAWRPPPPLVRRAWRLELGERIDAQGNILQPLDLDEIMPQVERLRADGID